MTQRGPVSANEPSGLGGWLILPGIALIIALLTTAYSLFTDFLPVFQEGIWQELTTPGTAAYHHLWAPLIVFEVAVSLTVLGFLAVLLYLFFNKSYRFPGLFIAYLLIHLALLIVDALLSNQIPLLAEQFTEEGLLRDLAPSVALAVIWIPYFLRSERVKNTFVEGRPDSALEQARQHLELAYSHEAADRLEPALSECELAIQLAPDFGEAHNLRGVILESLGRGTEAIAAYREAVGLDPSLAEASENLREARAKYVKPRAPEQADAVTSADAVPSTDAVTSAVSIEQQVSEAAVAAVEQEGTPDAPHASAIAETPAKKRRLPRWAIVVPIVVLAGLVLVWLAAGDPGQTEQAVTPDPELAQAFLSHGRTYLSEGDYDRAIADFDQAIALDPQSADAYRTRGGAYGLKGDFDQAIADYSQAIALDPQSGRVYRLRGWAYYAKGDDDQAIADFDQAITLDPEVADAYFGRARAYLEQGEYDQAIADLGQAITLDPEFADAYLGRGLVYSLKGNHDRAITDLERARDLAEDPGIRKMAEEALQELGQEPTWSAEQADSEEAEACVNRGDAYLKEGDFDQAIAEYDQAIALDPELAEAYYGRGYVYLCERDFEQAIAEYTQAISLDRELMAAYVDRGLAYALTGNFDQAIADLDQAVALDPGADAYYHRGMIYSLKGDDDQVIADLERALELGLGGDLKTEAESMLETLRTE